MNYLKGFKFFCNSSKMPSSCFRNISDVQKKIRNSYYFMYGDLNLSSSTLGEVLDETADQFGDDTAFISSKQGIVKSFSEFRHDVNRLASGLVSIGLKKGDRIAILAPNCYEWPSIQYAAAKAGLILVNLNPAFQPQEIEYCLKKVDCKALITWDVLKTQNFYEILCKMIPELPSSNPKKFLNSNFNTLDTIIMISEDKKSGLLNFKDVIESGNKESDLKLSSIEKSVQFDDAVNIQFTSGTTGMPKGALLTHHNIVNNALVFGRRMGYNLLKPVICCQVPLFHCFGCVVGTICSVLFQGTCVFPCLGYSAAESLKAIEQSKCTAMMGTPTMFVDLLNSYQHQKSDVASLKHAIIGGSPATESLVKNLKEELKLPYVHIAYGSTENSPAVALTGLTDDFQNAVKSIVQPLEYIELKVVDDKNDLVPVGIEGELCVKGHGLFLGYWNDEQKTTEAVDNKLWYHTGDLCLMNEYGFIKITGRKKDMIIRGGENIYPLEIENFLNNHPAILESSIVGVPDKRMGEEICAWISIKSDTTLTEEDVKAFCKGKISHFKIPRYIMFVKEFPKTQSGKIKKFEMARISKEELKL